MLERRKSLKGGYAFKRLRGTPKPIVEEAPLPKQVVIPLRQGFGEEVPATVDVGARVEAGQIIGIQDASVSSPVHASVSGSVEKMVRLAYPDGEVNAVVIASDGARGWRRIEGAGGDAERRSAHEVAEILYRAGVTALGRSGIPTKYTTSPVGPEAIDALILHAVNAEPFSAPTEALLGGRTDAFVTGIKVLRRALSDVEVHLGISDQDRGLLQEIERAAAGLGWLHIHPLQPKHPQDYDEVLVRMLVGRAIPNGKSAVDVGVVVVDAQAVLHAYEAAVEGKPLIERMVALGGSAYKANVVLKVRLGTPLETMLQSRLEQGAATRVVLDSLLTNPIQEDLSLPVIRTTSSVIALEDERKHEFLEFLKPGMNRASFSNAFLSSIFPGPVRTDTSQNGEARPCVACNYCEEVCPVQIIPHWISKYVTHDLADETAQFRIMACIDCGLCTYVCPSKIPLWTHIQKGKMSLVR